METMKAAVLSHKEVVLVAIDLEVADSVNLTQILEVGLAIQPWAQNVGGIQLPSYRQFVVEEHRAIKNSFLAAISHESLYAGEEVVLTAELGDTIHAAFSQHCQGKSTLLVGHSIDHDLGWLRDHGIALSDFLEDVRVCDIAQVHQAMQQDHQRTGLARMADLYGTDSTGNHVALNDAVMTLEIAKCQMRRIMDTASSVA